MSNSKKLKEFRNKFFELSGKCSSILITTHLSPDPDAITSSLALYEILKRKYPKKNIRIVFSTEISEKWKTFSGSKKIESGTDISECLDEFDFLIFLDGKWYYRFSADSEKLQKSKVPKVCIDHHGGTADKFDLSLIDSKSTSTSELIFRIFLEDEKKIPKILCEKILLGILNDTGFFRFIDHQKSYIFPIVERLVNEGKINIDFLNYDYEGYPLRMFEIIQELVKNTKIVKIDGWPNLLSSYVTRDFIRKGKYTEVEVDESGAIYIAAFGRAIFNVPWALMAYPTEKGGVYIRLRSKPGSVNVRLLMQEIGIGGGHDNASGGIFKKEGKIDLDCSKCVEQVLSWLNSHNPKNL